MIMWFDAKSFGKRLKLFAWKTGKDSVIRINLSRKHNVNLIIDSQLEKMSFYQ